VTGGAGTDVLSQFENLIGSDYADTLTGNGGNNVLDGGEGGDILIGGAGADTLLGGAGNDSFVITLATDLAAGEVITGGDGTDELRFAATVASTLTLTEEVDVERVTTGTGTVALNVNAALAESALSIIGNAGANELTGSGYDDTLNGGAGNDTLIGGAGNDVLNGGLGLDSLTGGLGADVFLFNSTANAASNLDRIADFNVADDSIQLAKSVFAGLTGASGSTLTSDAFRSGEGFTSSTDAAHRIIYNTSTGALFYDADGTGTAAAAIQFAWVTAGTELTVDDFWLL
jgi:Ca2+-binding RTX toxin-like protein